MSSEYEGSEEVRGRFAEAVIGMCAIFGKDINQYDTIIDEYWNALATFIPIDEFEIMCKRMIAEMYKMPTPRHFLGLKNKEAIPNERPEKTKEEIEIEERHARGADLVGSMDDDTRTRLMTDAKHLVTAGLQGFAVGTTTLQKLMLCKAYDIAVTRAERREKA